jgi:hypothetical protein
MTGPGIHEVRSGTQRALDRDIMVALGMARVFFLHPPLNLQPLRGAFIEKGFHRQF